MHCSPISSTSALDGGGLLTPSPPSLAPGKRHGTRGWVSPRAGLDGRGKSRPPPVFDPRIFHSVASRNSDWAIPVHPEGEDCIEINSRIVNTLIQDDSRTYNFSYALDCEDKSSEFLNSLSPSGLPPHTLHLKIIIFSYSSFCHNWKHYSVKNVRSKSCLNDIQ